MSDNATAAANNITWHNHSVTQFERWKLSGHKGAIVWLTGLSGSGKSTVANEVDYMLTSKGKRSYLLDGDNVRHGLCSDLGFSAEDRNENIRRIGEVSKLMADSGMIVLAAFVSPYRTDRDAVRQRVAGTNVQFVEVYVNASIETCEARDPKGLYKKARAGIIKNFTGIDDPFEEPLKPEILLDANSKSAQSLANDIISWLEEHKILSVD
mmetsp:Transcript_18865/g.26599  ORF Transcript_18865/g.26599 Transcript_18865/m.26599 type:complete len:210 (+) Transcript_18865:112-741(+)